MKLTKHHITQNTINLVFLPICVLLIFLSFSHPNDTNYQARLAMTAGLLYIILSTIHHFFDKSLTFEIIFEYILIGSLAFLAVLTFII